MAIRLTNWGDYNTLNLDIHPYPTSIINYQTYPGIHRK